MNLIIWEEENDAVGHQRQVHRCPNYRLDDCRHKHEPAAILLQRYSLIPNKKKIEFPSIEERTPFFDLSSTLQGVVSLL